MAKILSASILALFVVGMASAEFVCYYTDDTCTTPSEFPCREGPPNTGAWYAHPSVLLIVYPL